MSKEVIPGGQSISIVILFIMGSSLIMGVAGESGNSTWVALLITLTLAVPLMCMYARLHVLFPGKELFDMLNAVFGRIAGTVISCLYIWYALHLGALVLRNFGEFTRTVALTETPMVVPMMCVGLLCVWAVKSGLEVLGRSAKFLFLFCMIVIVVVQILAVPLFDYEHLKPMLDCSWQAVSNDVFGQFTFPFAETVIFLGAFHVLPEKGSAYKVLLSGMLISGFFITEITVRNLLVLGPELLSSLYFPSYVAVSRINVGDFLTRIEGSSAIVFVTSLYIKVSLCLFVASNGLAKVLKLKSYRSVVLQLGFIMIYLSNFLYKNIMEMQYFAFHIYKVYALPFQVIIPGALWIGAEIKAKRNNAQKTQKTQKNKQ
ncbi:endospore germination permease [Paenibacillus sp. sgz500958]|uniref:GerAB/ArcD/ProY family transporter n=1 Tax=Paenibacillus sp. sgz500958 TaxID=3242475 RepID=UPI0036D31B34